MATYGELQSRVQQIIIDLPTAVTAQVPTLVRESVRRLQRLHDFKVAEARTSVFTTAPVTRTLGAVPSNWYKWRGKPQIINTSGKHLDLAIFQDRASAEREFGSESGGEADATLLAGSPKALSLSEPTDELGAMNFEVWPFSDTLSLYSDGEYRIVVPYYKFLTQLVDVSDQNWLTNNAEQWIVWQAASDGFLLDWDENRASVWAQRAATAFKEVIDADKRLRFSEITELRPSSNARDTRWAEGDTLMRGHYGFTTL